MTYDYRMGSSVTFNGWRIREQFKPHRQWVLESSDQVIYLTWSKPEKIETNIVTDDNEEHDVIPKRSLASWLYGIDSRLKLLEIEVALEDE